MSGVPLGFRFDPSDEELIRGFLLPKLMGFPLPWEGILDKDLYADAPWNVFRDIDESSNFWQRMKRIENSKIFKKSIYIFTKLKRVKASNNKISRMGGCGTWDGQTGSNDIQDSLGNVVGSTRMFRFQMNSNWENSFGGWIMHEYCAAGATADDFVLCKITNTTSANGGALPLVADSGSEEEEEEVSSHRKVDQNWNAIDLLDDEDILFDVDDQY